MRISVKELESRINTINELTNNKYQLKLFTTTGCGVDISINGEWQKSNMANKEAMQLLNEKFGKEIRKIMLEQFN